VAAAAHARLTPAAGRKFAFTLAIGFAAIGALFAWRGVDVVARLCWAIAGVSAGAGVLVPTRLGGVERAWTALGVALSRVVRPVFFTILYLVAVTPTGWLRRTFGRSPIAREPDADSYWHPRTPRDADTARRSLERQF